MRLNAILSSKCNVILGVLQALVLEQLLFSFFVDGHFLYVHTCVFLLACQNHGVVSVQSSQKTCW